MDEETIRLREEIAEQIKALQGMKKMAAVYGYDISGPATTAKEAVQWLILRLPCSNQDPERCSYVRWTYLHIPGYLY